jgi:hypothetical protein
MDGSWSALASHTFCTAVEIVVAIVQDTEITRAGLYFACRELDIAYEDLCAKGVRVEPAALAACVRSERAAGSGIRNQPTWARSRLWFPAASAR